MKIVLTVHQFLPDFAAGTEVLTYNTAKELQRRGHEVIVWTAYPTGEPCKFDEYQYEGLTVHRYFYNQVEAATNSNVMEVEYNNIQFGERFQGFLKEYKPDIIHFFHLGRLSSTAILAGKAEKIPMVFTATDFWMVCPTSQLRLRDNSLCMGPDRFSLNCIRHIAAVTQPPEISNKLDKLPDPLLAALAWGTRQKWWPEQKYSPLVASLTRRKNFQKNVMNLLDRVLVPTKLMLDILTRNGLNPAIARSQHYGIDLSNIKEMIPFKKSTNELHLGFIGTLYEHKGPHVLLEAIRLLDRNAPVKLSLYGKLHEFPDYVKRLKEISGDDERISFCGTFPNETIGDVLSDIDVLVVPSIWHENAPLVAYSAQATKTPVIASNVGGLSEIIHHGVNGLLFKMGDPKDLSSQIKRILDEDDLLEKMSMNAEMPKSMQIYVDELELIYDEMKQEGGGI